MIDSYSNSFLGLLISGPLNSEPIKTLQKYCFYLIYANVFTPKMQKNDFFLQYIVESWKEMEAAGTSVQPLLPLLYAYKKRLPHKQ